MHQKTPSPPTLFQAQCCEPAQTEQFQVFWPAVSRSLQVFHWQHLCSGDKVGFSLFPRDSEGWQSTGQAGADPGMAGAGWDRLGSPGDGWGRLGQAGQSRGWPCPTLVAVALSGRCAPQVAPSAGSSAESPSSSRSPAEPMAVRAQRGLGPAHTHPPTHTVLAPAGCAQSCRICARVAIGAFWGRCPGKSHVLGTGPGLGCGCCGQCLEERAVGDAITAFKT